jgi:phosphatidylglycerophosphate synthase
VPRDDADRRAWSDAHGGLEPDGSRWVSGYLSLVHAAARPLAAREVSPDAVTAAGLAFAALVPLATLPGAGWPLLATVVVVLSALVDGVDGAVARMTGSTSAWGGVLDPLADRVSELLYLLAVLALGAPGWSVALVGVLTLLHESVRATARVAGMAEAGAVTVWERPMRVVYVAFTLGVAGLLWCWARLGLTTYGVRQADVATVGTVLAALVAVAGLAHLLVVVRRALA